MSKDEEKGISTSFFFLLVVQFVFTSFLKYLTFLCL